MAVIRHLLCVCVPVCVCVCVRCVRRSDMAVQAFSYVTALDKGEHKLYSLAASGAPPLPVLMLLRC